MRYRPFGNTGWQVSSLALGTVTLGVESYGLYHPGEAARPSDDLAKALLLRALEGGVTLVDTAPGYGRSEELVGAALRDWGEPGGVYVATKVAAAQSDEVRLSIEESLRRLGRERLDLVQVHNATARDLEGPVVEALLEARQRGEVDRLGASVYGVADAMAAVRAEPIDVVQVAFNLLDQRANPAEGGLFREAEARGVALLVRSALLKGVLTSRRRQLPAALSTLQRSADRAERWARRYGLDLTSAALRFCLSQREVGSVLVGVRNLEELDGALAAAEAEPLERHWLADAEPLALDEESLIDPRRWDVP